MVSYGVLAWDYCVVNGDLAAGLFSEREGYMRGFFSFIFKPHFWNHFSMESRLRWRVDEAIAGSSPVARGQHIYPGKRPSHKKTQAGRTPVKMNIAASAEIITCRNSAYFGINRH